MENTPQSQKLMIDISGLAGLAPKFYGDANTAQGYGITGVPNRRWLGAKGAMAQGFWNAFRVFGYMAPPTSMSASSIAITYSDASHKQDSELVAILYDSLGTDGANGIGVWAASKDSVFYQSTSGNAFSLATYIDPGFVSGTPTIRDLQVYQVNGINKIFFSYANSGGTHGDIGIIGPDHSSDNVTWFSATTSGGGTFLGATSNLVMVPAADNYLYILDINNVHKIDGTALTGGSNGTVTEGVLIFPAERMLVDAVDFNGLLWMVAQTNQNAPGSNALSYNEHKIDVYSWNRQTGTASTIQSTPIEGMQSVQRIYATPDGDLRIIGISTNRTVQIRRYNGSTFEIMQELPIWAFPPYRDSCTYFEGMFCWIGRDGKIYAHGKLPALQQGTLSQASAYASDQLFILGDMSPLLSADANIGSILPVGVGIAGSFASPPTSLPAIIFSYASGSTFKTYQWFPNGTGTISGVNQVSDSGNPYSLVQRLPGLSNVNYVRVWCLPQGSGGSTQLGTFSIFKNQSDSALGTYAVTQTDIERGYFYQPLGKNGQGAFALQFEISWETNVTLGDTTDWLPYLIEVDYTEDTKLK